MRGIEEKIFNLVLCSEQGTFPEFMKNGKQRENHLFHFPMLVDLHATNRKG